MKKEKGKVSAIMREQALDKGLLEKARRLSLIHIYPLETGQGPGAGDGLVVGHGDEAVHQRAVEQGQFPGIAAPLNFVAAAASGVPEVGRLGGFAQVAPYRLSLIHI